MRADDVLGRVILVTGKEEFLGERTVQEVRATVRAHDPESEFSEAGASDLTLATLGELSAPSLFSAVRCIVVRALENLPEESVDGLLGYAADPSPDVALVLVHGGGPEGVGHPHQAPQGQGRHGGRSPRRSRPRSTRGSWPPSVVATARRSTARRAGRWSTPWARTCAP